MASKHILRTAHVGDIFVVDDKLTITAEGVEVPAGRVEDVMKVAADNGVRLFEVEDQPESKVPAQNQGGGN